MQTNKTIREENDVDKWLKEISDLLLTKEREKTNDQIDYNAHDMGEMGKFIRTEYAKNILSTHDQVILSVLREELREVIGRRRTELTTLLTQLQEIEDMVEAKRKTETYPQSLNTYDGKVEHFERLSDGDIHYNQALSDIAKALKEKKDKLNK